MTDVLGLSLQEALEVLEPGNGEKPIRILETSGYKASEDMDLHNDIRAVGIRKIESETVLIVARF